MQLFYLEKPQKEILLSTEESKHAIKVLRKKDGDILNFTDGKGILYKAKITNSNTRKCNLEIISSETKEKKHNYHLHIGIAPTKNIDLMNDNRTYLTIKKTNEQASIIFYKYRCQGHIS